jgi:hypothetical protein
VISKHRTPKNSIWLTADMVRRMNDVDPLLEQATLQRPHVGVAATLEGGDALRTWNPAIGVKSAQTTGSAAFCMW